MTGHHKFDAAVMTLTDEAEAEVAVAAEALINSLRPMSAEQEAALWRFLRLGKD
jgi:hypothetical protein